MSLYLAARLLKFISLALLAGGSFGCLSHEQRAARIRSLQLLSIGFIGTWSAGYLIMKESARTLKEPWILASILTSMLSLHLFALAAHKESPKPVTPILALGTLFAAFATMSIRSENPGVLAAIGLAAIVVAAPCALWARAKQPTASEHDAQPSWSWFRWIARFEGLSLIVMLLISVPLKKAAGISVDGGTGLLGWAHGVLFVLYIQALMSTGSLLGWSWKERAIGFVASLIPFGTFYFEHRVQKQSNHATSTPAS